MNEIRLQIEIDEDFRCSTCGRQAFDYLELVDLIECTYCMECFNPAQARRIPYDEIRRLCGLPDVSTYIVQRDRELAAAEADEWFSRVLADLAKRTPLSRDELLALWAEVKPTLPVDAFTESLESAIYCALTFGQSFWRVPVPRPAPPRVFLDHPPNMAEGGRVVPWTTFVDRSPEPDTRSVQERALPRPSSMVPMWAQNPARTRRSRNHASDIRTPNK